MKIEINFRKFLCGIFKKGSWLYRVCDCKRYEPPEFVTVKLCKLCNKLVVAGCIASGNVIEVDYVKGEEPTERSVNHLSVAYPRHLRHRRVSTYSYLKNGTATPTS
jgi:hypothetical protein